jgi:hypothetical protein
MGQIMRLRRRATAAFGIEDQNNGYGHENAFTRLIERYGSSTRPNCCLVPTGGSLVKALLSPSGRRRLAGSLPTAARALLKGKDLSSQGPCCTGSCRARSTYAASSGKSGPGTSASSSTCTSSVTPAAMSTGRCQRREGRGDRAVARAALGGPLRLTRRSRRRALPAGTDGSRAPAVPRSRVRVCPQGSGTRGENSDPPPSRRRSRAAGPGDMVTSPRSLCTTDRGQSGPRGECPAGRTSGDPDSDEPHGHRVEHGEFAEELESDPAYNHGIPASRGLKGG